MIQSGRLPAWFGLNIDPHAQGIGLARDLARYADESGLDLIGVQDHPYNGVFLDTWTFLTALGTLTTRVRLLSNVASLPLRPPAMLGKAAATLDLLTGGRVELGLGAGAAWDAIASYGGPRRTPGEAVDALEEAIHVMRLLWTQQDSPQRASFPGRYYGLDNAQIGPTPAHRIGIWLGALKPRMLRLTGRLADGLSISHNWVPPEQVPALQQLIDEAADAAGRDPQAIRRNYNVMGMIQSPAEMSIHARQPGMIMGTTDTWIDTLVRFYTSLGMDTFIFWPVAGDAREQARHWSEEVVPGVRERLAML